MEKLSKIVFCFSLVLLTIAGGLVLIQNTSSKMMQYEIQNNCKYDYNGLCYTEQERPWLF